jgi:hypothetical protein
MGIFYLYRYLCHKYPHDHQMDNTHNHAIQENNDNSNANPPPLPRLEQVLIVQAQMLQTMQQTMANMQQAQGQQPSP